MAVRISPLNILGSNPALQGVTTFADPFNPGGPGSGALSIGNNWAQLMLNFGTATAAGAANASIGTQTDASIGCNIAYLGAINPTVDTNIGWVPTPLMNAAVFNAGQQFVQTTWVSMSSNLVGGLMCFAQQGMDGTGSGGGTYAGYVLIWNTGANTVVLRDNWNVSGTSIIAGGILPAPALHDVWRMSVDCTNPLHNTITVTVNGVVKGTATDSVAGFLNTRKGYPGIEARALNQTGTLQIRAWSGGVGL